ncbi:MAG: DNA adenine methylase [Faecalimonas sp.]|nr:DNA adenine methylase [Faecalimonas sp.]
MVNSDINAVRPVHYLGSKLRMLEAVKATIDEVDITQGCICDLFSGSGTITSYFLNYRDVISVDIQNYSSVLCEATTNQLDEVVNTDEIITEILNSDSTIRLIQSSKALIEYEEFCISSAINGELQWLYEIIDNGSIYIYLKGETQGLSDELHSTLNNTCNELKKQGILMKEDYMITRLFGGLYFSYKQAVDMDCLAKYIFTRKGLLKTKMLAALLSTASEIVNTVGKQFAQPLKVKNNKGECKKNLLDKIVADRTLNVFEIYRKWLTYYVEIKVGNHTCKTMCVDYKDALDALKEENVSVIYADPPYTRYHYSRYYHVLETICLRDNPEASTTFPNGKGGISRAVYRLERHQSPFCIKSKAEGAFEALFSKVKELNVPLVLSYSPFDESQAVTPRLRTIEQLVELARKYFLEVNIVSPGTFTHSKLNSVDKNFDANHEAEVLIVCKP